MWCLTWFLVLLSGQWLLAGPAPGSLPKIADQIKGLDRKVRDLSMKAAKRAWNRGHGPKRVLTVIDYSLPSTRKRLWVIDLSTGELLFHELVAHGKGSGENLAKTFSNTPGSLASSLGMFETRETYLGKHGYSLKLEGLEPGFNDKAAERSIVIHGAWYVGGAFARKHGRLGRSWGCPALEKGRSRQVIDTIKNRSLVFVYYPDESWLKTSGFLNVQD